MSSIVTIGLLSFSSILAFLFSISPFTPYTAQFVALIAIVLISLSTIFHQQLLGSQKTYFYSLISLLVSVLVFTTNGLSSPLFFLIYFLLFAIALQNPPSITLTFSLILILLLSSSLDSPQSLIQIASLLFVTPLVWFIGRQYLENHQLNTSLAQDETDVFYWLTLKFKTGIIVIIDAASQLLSQPLSPTQKDLTKKIKDSAKSLYNSSQNLTQELDRRTDET